MAEAPFYNQGLLDEFKNEIQYKKIISGLPDDKFVQVDWSSLLNNITDSNGVVWKGDDYGSYQVQQYGELTSTLVSDLGAINVTIHSIPSGQKSAIDFALRSAATTSMDSIQMKYYQSYFSDFCLIGMNPRVVNFIMYIFGNIFVELEYYNDYKRNDYNQDVLPIARYIQSVMEKAVASNPDKKLPSRPQFKYTINQSKIKAKSSFTLTVEPGIGYSREFWDFGVAKELNSEHVEYDEQLGSGVYKFINRGQTTFFLSSHKQA
ncbi:MAG: hypothetical protein COB30_012845 [Ectothiorhodospiraceae bacterium]|nr:hypothetical protein [Ectothiorhodospiraceae bacterium]